MNITRIEVIPLVRKLQDTFEGGTYRIVNRNTLVTRVHTACGIGGEVFGGDEDMWQAEVVVQRSELREVAHLGGPAHRRRRGQERVLHDGPQQVECIASVQIWPPTLREQQFRKHALIQIPLRGQFILHSGEAVGVK